MTAGATATPIPLDDPSPRPPDACPVEDWMAFLGHRWTSLILRHLQERPRRYRELEALLPGITSKVLRERLDGLERRGLLERRPLAIYPRGVSYQLWPAGASLVKILNQLEPWSKATRSTRHSTAGLQRPSSAARTPQR
jgi:DNA-binding HxlR family transcriptional regulator